MKNYAFMAFAAGKVSSEETSIKRYIGVGSVRVLAVNPNKAELEKIYNTTIDNEPEYVSEVVSGDAKIPSVRIDFIVSTDPKKDTDIDMISKISFFVRKEARMNNDKTKVEVIDKYGRTAWVTLDQNKNHEIPMYKNGPANICEDYRPAFSGEEDLTNFLIAYLNIPNPMKYNRDTREWSMVENPEDSEAILEHINQYFDGNFKELKDIIALQPNNKVKALFGVKTTDTNKQYQTVYTQMFLKNGVSPKNYSRLAEDVESRQANGSYPTTEFEVVPLKEYKVEATNFDNADDLPSDNPAGVLTPTPWGK